MLVQFLLVILSSVSIFKSLCSNENNSAKPNGININGYDLEIFDLCNGINNAGFIINKDVKININNKYFIYADKVEKPGIKSKNNKNNKKIYFTGAPVIKGDDLKVNAECLVLDIQNKKLEISGNVECGYKNIKFSSNSCVFDVKTNTFSFYNNGKLNVDSVTITSCTGDFYIDSNKVVLRKGAVIKMDNYILTCDSIEITKDNIRCIGSNKITIRDRNVIISTKNDVFITDNNNIIKLSKCLANSDEFIIYGEDVLVNIKDKRISVHNCVEILNKDNYYITANNVSFNYDNSKGVISGNSLIKIGSSEESGGIYISSDSINFNLIKAKDRVLPPDVLDNFNIYSYGNAEYFSSKKNNNLEQNIVSKVDADRYESRRGTYLKGSQVEFNINGKVELYSKNLKIRSSNIKYKNSEIQFNDKVLIWQGNNRLVSNKALVYFENGIKKVILKDKPFISMLKGIYPSQIKSEEIYMSFKNNKINKILFNKDVETLLYIFNDAELRYINNLKTNSLCVLFDSDLNPIKVLFNKNSGKIITFKEVSENPDVLFMDRYNNLSDDIPKFDNIAKKILKKSNIPISAKLKLLNKQLSIQN